MSLHRIKLADGEMSAHPIRGHLEQSLNQYPFNFILPPNLKRLSSTNHIEAKVEIPHQGTLRSPKS